MPKHSIPQPEPGREPIKANVYRFVQNSVTALAPLFPYCDEGSIVPCVTSFRGGPGKRFGRFQHFNTVDEVFISFGARGGRGRPGTVRVGPKLHPVGAPFQNPEDPDSLMITAITQRQLAGKPQREEYRFICDKCDRRLYIEEVDATPPKRGRQSETLGRHAPFVTIIETYHAAKRFNESESARTCKHCGHVNPPFPIETWGWDVHVRQTDLAREAFESLSQARRGTSQPVPSKR